VPIAASAARYLWLGDGRGNWQTADRSSAGFLPPAAAHPDAVVRVFAARTVRWRSIFAVHTWIVVKENGATSYSRYDYTVWGEPIRTNGFAPDGRWFWSDAANGRRRRRRAGRGAHSEGPLRHRELQVSGLRRRQRLAGTELEHPRSGSSGFGSGAPGGPAAEAIGKNFPYSGRWIGVTSSGTGVYLSLAGYVGLTVGWVEGFEVNFFGAVMGFDIRRPALKLPGLGRFGIAAGL
jgi:hypothetical protein